MRLLLLVGAASLRPTHLHYSNGLCEILDGRNLRGQSAIASPCHALSIELGRCSAYWKQKADCFDTNLPLYRKHLRQLQVISSKLKAAVLICRDGSLTIFLDAPACRQIKNAVAELPGVHTTAVLGNVDEKVKEVVGDALGRCKYQALGEGGSANSVGIRAVGEAVRAILEMPKTVVPESKLVWDTVSKEFVQVAEHSEQSVVVNKV